MLNDVCGDRLRPPFGASAANVTRPTPDGRSAGQRGSSAIPAAGSQARSGGLELPPGLEERRTARPLGRGQTFFERFHHHSPGVHPQQGQGPHGQCDVTMPTGLAPNFILIQAQLAFRGAEAPPKCPTGARHTRHLLQRGVLQGQDDIDRQISKLAATAACRQPGLVFPPRPFGAISPPQAPPAVLRQRGQDGFDAALLLAHPNRFLARDRQPKCLWMGFQLHPQPSIGAIRAIASHPAGHTTCGQRAGQHLPGQLGLDRQWVIFRNPSLLIGPDRSSIPRAECGRSS
jgi:hypothetical protein